MDRGRYIFPMKIGHRTNTEIRPGEFRRPAMGPTWTNKQLGLPVLGAPAWQSNGGPDRGHFARSKPYTLEVAPPRVSGTLTRIHLIGLFAMYAAYEEPGSIGATISVSDERTTAVKLDLIYGRHYSDASDTEAIHRLTGDGASVETVGHCVIDGTQYRVDQLTIDLPSSTGLLPLKVRVSGSPASFVVFDVLYEFVPEAACPFSRRGGGVALGDLAAVVRVGDRVRLRRALDQLEYAVMKTEDLDEAKGEALTFIAVVTAATLEMGAPRAMHRVQLDAARRLDPLQDRACIAAETRRFVEGVTIGMGHHTGSPSAALIDRALEILSRNFAKDLTDVAVAEQLGLSTSHFRFLFKETTGQPFHRYLISLRLEKAKNLLLDGQMPVSDVAFSVGFNGLAHFSRAFTQRFSISPTNLRRNGAGML